MIRSNTCDRKKKSTSFDGTLRNTIIKKNTDLDVFQTYIVYIYKESLSSLLMDNDDDDNDNDRE
jgi:hypothetical protein